MTHDVEGGRLLLVPTPLDFGIGDGAASGDLQASLPLGVIREAAAVAHWVVENARSARAFLKRVDAVVPLARPLQEIGSPNCRAAKGRQGRPPADLTPLLEPACTAPSASSRRPGCRRSPTRALRSSARPRTRHPGRATARRQRLAARPGGERPERPGLHLRRLPAAGDRRACRAVARARARSLARRARPSSSSRRPTEIAPCSRPLSRRLHPRRAFRSVAASACPPAGRAAPGSPTGAPDPLKCRPTCRRCSRCWRAESRVSQGAWRRTARPRASWV